MDAADSARARSDSPSTIDSRRRVSSYSRAFSMAPATSVAAWTRKSESARVNSRGAWACSAITPITWPDLACSGAAHSDWYFSSSASGTTLARGIVGSVLGDEDRLVVFSHPPRQALARLEPQPARQRGVGIGHRPQHQPVVVWIDEVDPAGVAVDGFADQIDDGPQHPVEVERRGHRVDDLVQVPALDGAGRAQLVGHGGCVRNGHITIVPAGLAGPCRSRQPHTARGGVADIAGRLSDGVGCTGANRPPAGRTTEREES